MKPVEDTLERELRAMRPEIDRDFATKLDAWAAEGFPARGQSPAPAGQSSRRAPRLRLTLPRLAFAASMILIVGTVSVGVLSSDRDSVVPLSRESGVPESSTDPEAGSADATTTVPGLENRAPGEEKLLPGQEREVVRDASMTLSTEPAEIAEVADEVIEVTERYDGIVLRSDVQTQAERARASFDLRIPAQNLQATLADLSDLASVSERNEASLDVTAPFVSAEERFDDAKAEVDALVERLAEADDADEIAQIRERLAVARSELAAARAELAALKQRTDFSKLAVTVTGDADADGWSLGDALDDAGSVLEDVTGATLVALAAIVPLSLISAALWFGLRAARRRARERTLDG
jgi:hypothetical protein